MTIEIRLSSATTPDLAEPAEDLLRAVAKDELVRSEVGHDGKTSKGDPVAIATLILSIPAAIVGTMDLAQRAGVVELIRALLKKVRKTDGTATLHVGTEPPLDLKTATEDEVIDVMAKSDPPGSSGGNT